jgi:hypothetical protein
MSKGLKAITPPELKQMLQDALEVSNEAKTILAASYNKTVVADRAKDHLAPGIIKVGANFKRLAETYNTLMEVLRQVTKEGESHRESRVLYRLRLSHVLNMGFADRLNFLFNPKAYKDFYGNEKLETGGDGRGQAEEHQDGHPQ